MKPYLIGLLFSKYNLELGKTEALLCFKTYFEVEEILFVDNFCVFSVKGVPGDILNCVKRLAFTKEAFVVSKNVEWSVDLISFVNDFNLKHGVDSCFKVELFLKQKNIDLINTVANVVLESGLSGKICLSKPDLVVCSFIHEFYGLSIWVNKDPYRLRRPHLKVKPHPSGIDPRLAKAMINLASAKKEVMDPFCGAGGILEEVKLLGLNYVGVDVSWKMINLARANLNSKDNLFCMNALSWDKKVECVVTDLPYGKNSKLDGSLDSLISGFFDVFNSLTSRIVVCAPNTYDLESVAFNHGWSLLFKFEVYVHGSLTRRIHVFELNK
ncbi:hypothetical protein KO361_01960 [Candidatus Woesearchaeota archaeon]|nr:hypothetical protein [Candidatus Woesearchaeota archaeon]